MKGFERFRCFVSVLLVVIFSFSTTVWSAVPLWQGKLRPGIMAGNSDSETDYFIDLLMPITGDESSLIFFNPHYRSSNDESSEINLGIGYRTFADNGSWIFGGHLFYDAMESRYDNSFHQIGVGVEAMSDQFDLRANYYHPYGTTKERIPALDKYTFGSSSLLIYRGYEEALQGFDAEVGFLVPGISDTMETRIFGGGYWYPSDIASDITGFKARLEIRPMQILNIDLEYKNDDINDTAYIGGYLNLPFSIGEIFAGNNPFSGIADMAEFGTGTRPLTERMTDKVIRDRHIVAPARTDSKPERARSQGGDMIDMIFVDGDNTGAGAGTYNDPYQDIASVEGDDLYADGAWVYVFGSTNPQADVNFALLDDMVLWGEGYSHPLYGLGGGASPVLDGGAVPDVNVVTLAEGNEVMGLTIQNGAQYGIYGEDILEANIHHNIVQDNAGVNGGIWFNNNFTGSNIADMTMTYTISSNQILNNSSNGVYIYTMLNAPSSITDSALNYNFNDNTITGNGSIGIYVYHEIYTNNTGEISDLSVDTAFAGNTITGNNNTGVELYSDTYTDDSASSISNVSITNTFINNNSTISDNGGYGVYSTNNIYTNYTDSSLEDSSIIHVFTNNVISENSSDGVGLNGNIYGNDDDSTITDALIESSFTGNEINENSSRGVQIFQDIYSDYTYARIDGAVVANTFEDNTINGNADDGVFLDNTIYTGESFSSLSNAAITNRFINNNNTISSNGGYGVYNNNDIYTDYNYSPLNTAVITNEFTDNAINDNSYDGVYLNNRISTLYDYSVLTNALIDNSFTGNEIDDNGDQGVYIENYIYSDYTASDLADAEIKNRFDDNTINGNSDDGVYLDSEIYTDESYSTLSNAAITNSFTNNNNTISNNGGYGLCIYSEIWTYYDEASISSSTINNIIDNNTITGNASDGIYLYSDFDTDDSNSAILNSWINDTITDNTVSGNSGYGMYLDSNIYDYESVYDIITNVLLQGNTVINNDNYGVYFGYDIDGTFIGDIGGGLLGSLGNSSFYGNTTWDFYNTTVSLLPAESNWWGADADPGAQIGGSSLDYTPWLSSSPL